MSLLDTYENMQAIAKADEDAHIEKQAEDAVVEQRVDVLAKYAEAADKILAEEYGEKYSEEDVVKLAAYMLDTDIDEEESVEKVAEYVEAGQVMARSFVEELSKNLPEDAQ